MPIFYMPDFGTWLQEKAPKALGTPPARAGEVRPMPRAPQPDLPPRRVPLLSEGTVARLPERAPAWGLRRRAGGGYVPGRDMPGGFERGGLTGVASERFTGDFFTGAGLGLGDYTPFRYSLPRHGLGGGCPGGECGGMSGLGQTYAQSNTPVWWPFPGLPFWPTLLGAGLVWWWLNRGGGRAAVAADLATRGARSRTRRAAIRAAKAERGWF